MKINTLSQKMRSGVPTLGTRVLLPEPGILEIIGHTRMFDYIEFLGEYSSFTLHDLDSVARVSENAGLDCIIKIDYENNRYVAQRAVGSGFSGCLFADLRTKEDVTFARDSVRPDTPRHKGRYGANPRRISRPDYGGSDRYIEYLEDQLIGIMVEKPEMVHSLQEILPSSEIDFVQWGPTDYAMSSGASTEELLETEKFVMDVCKAAGVPFRVEVKQAAEILPYMALGVKHFSIGIELNVLHESFLRLGRESREIMEAIR